MATITIPKKQYDTLRRQASLYRSVLKKEEGLFPMELYSSSRLKEFLREDVVDPKLRNKVIRLLRKKIK